MSRTDVAPRLGENRLFPALAVVVAAGLQLVLPDRLSLRPHLLLPVLELALLGGLILLNPVRIDTHHLLRRPISLGLTAAMTVANVGSAALLIHDLILGPHHGAQGAATSNAVDLLGSGASIYVTNVIAFALWYWEFDRGGPVARLGERPDFPDFLFPQMVTPESAPAGWRPEFLDYLYVSFTNATAFSPTDTMPLSRGAKMFMLAQSGVALIVVGLVIARAVNVLQ